MYRLFIITIAAIGLLTGNMLFGSAIAAEKQTTTKIDINKADTVALVKTADNWLLMLDSSSSMRDLYDQAEIAEMNMTGMEAMIAILREKNKSLPNLDWQAGIYSHTPGTGGLTSFVTYLPMQTYDKEKFAAAVDLLPTTPSGPTLLQGGLEGLDRVLSTLKGKTVVFIFTDGLTTPQKHLDDPITIANRIAKKHDVCFYVISSAVGPTAKAVVDAVARTTTCSRVIPFTELLHKPEWMTDALFKVSEQTAEPANDQVVGLVVNTILFDFDRAAIKPTFNDGLTELTTFMRDNPAAHLTLAGYTDNRGGEAYNMQLSRRRANAVQDFLLAKGVERDSICLSWFGSADPVAKNMDNTGRSSNRRVTGIITGL